MTKLAKRSGRDRARPLGGELLRHRDFRLLWAGEAVSDLGSGVSVLAIPLIAIGGLHAGTFEVAALSAARSSAYLLVSLPAGALVDRTRRRITMAMDADRFLALGTATVSSPRSTASRLHFEPVGWLGAPDRGVIPGRRRTGLSMLRPGPPGCPAALGFLVDEARQMGGTVRETSQVGGVVAEV